MLSRRGQFQGKGRQAVAAVAGALGLDLKEREMKFVLTGAPCNSGGLGSRLGGWMGRKSWPRHLEDLGS